MKISITELARVKIIEYTPKDMNDPLPGFVWMSSRSPNDYILKSISGYWRMVLGWYERDEIWKEGIILPCGIELLFDASNLKDRHDEAIIDYINKRFNVSFE